MCFTGRAYPLGATAGGSGFGSSNCAEAERVRSRAAAVLWHGSGCRSGGRHAQLAVRARLPPISSSTASRRSSTWTSTSARWAPDGFAGLDTGEVDIYPEVWLPNFNSLVKKYVDEQEDRAPQPQGCVGDARDLRHTRNGRQIRHQGHFRSDGSEENAACSTLMAMARAKCGSAPGTGRRRASRRSGPRATATTKR